ncbi:MAG: AAA family ATPase [Bacillota bacterium]
MNQQIEIENNPYISELKFNDGTSLNLKSDDIVIFVGPNNSGKSQSIKDIRELLYSKLKHSVVVKSIKIKDIDKEDKLQKISQYTLSVDNGNYTKYEGYNCSFISSQIGDMNGLNNSRDFFVSQISTENRLTVCEPPKAIDCNESIKHPIHYLVRYPEAQDLISKNFKKAFGYDLILNANCVKTIPLCMGEHVKFGENEVFKNEQERQMKYGEILAQYPKIHEQGDGIKSFVGIILHLFMKQYSIFCIDEPESFLHPPQANIMGKTVGEVLKNQQAFIATHSQDFLKGVLSVCPSRVKIVRITRDGDKNGIAILNNYDMESIWSDSLLKHSNIMDSLFHNVTVLCESDSDCKIYSIIDSYIKGENGHYSDSLFIHCGGKHKMYKIVNALMSLKIDYRIIPDIDILNDSKIVSKLFESCGGNWDTLITFYSQLSNGITGGKSVIAIDKIISSFSELKNQGNENISKSQLTSKIKEISPQTKWDLLKSGGIINIPRGDATTAYNYINEEFKRMKIFLVPCGELENFDKEIGGHGPDWANAFIEKYNNLGDVRIKSLMDFVQSWHL